MKYVLAALVVLSIGGCTLPMNRTATLNEERRENVAQKATSEFAQAVQPTPLHIKLQDGTTISQPAPSQVTARAEAGEHSDSAAAYAATRSVRLPLSIALLVGVIALAGLGGVVWFAVNRSRALGAAWRTGDEALGRLIHKVRTHQTTATNPDVISALKVAEAEAQHERAELNKD